MANILIADDDKNFLLSFVDGLTAQDDEFQVMTAENGDQALRILESTAIDLVITDLKMPVMDGFELLAAMSRLFPRIPVIVITAFGTPEIEERISTLGGFQYLEKPLDLNVTIERIYEELEAKSSGFIHGISLPSFLQLMEIEKKSCTLTVHSEGNNGKLYFKQGDLIDAETDDLEGEAAAFTIISWENAGIEITPKSKKRAKKITNSLDYIVMEAYRRKDECERESNQEDDPYDDTAGIVVSYEDPGLDLPLLSELDPVSGNQENTKKEITMNMKKINDAMEALKTDVGEGLLASSIVSSSDGQQIADYNGMPKVCALFTQVTKYLYKTLKDGGLDHLGKYYIVDMTNNKTGIVMPLGDFWWGMITDTQKAPLGMLLNVAIPQAIERFEEAVIG